MLSAPVMSRMILLMSSPIKSSRAADVLSTLHFLLFCVEASGCIALKPIC
jgi:hypothetical protein